jgi:hypothetical protein
MLSFVTGLKPKTEKDDDAEEPFCSIRKASDSKELQASCIMQKECFGQILVNT